LCNSVADIVCKFVHRLKLKVQATRELQIQNTATVFSQWTEIIEDLWDLLPHFQQWYDEDCLKFDCVKLQFGDGKDSDNDNEIWLDHDLAEKESPATVEETKQISQSIIMLNSSVKLIIPVYISCACYTVDLEASKFVCN